VAVGSACYTRLDVDTSLALLTGALFVVGLGHGLITPSLMAGAFRGLSREDVPSASTTANILARLGTSAGTAALAVVLQIAVRTAVPGADTMADATRIRTPQVTEALTGAFGTSLWWTVGITALAILPTVLIPTRQPAGSAAG